LNSLPEAYLGIPSLTALPVSGEVAPGAPVAVISHPRECLYSLTTGVVSRLCRRVVQGVTVPRIQTTTDFARGSSGGPLFNSHGQVVGFVATTESVCYDEQGARQKNLQIVIHSCVPTSALLRLLSGAR